MQVHNNFHAKEIEFKIKPQSIASYYYGTLCKYGFISSPSPKRLQRKLSVRKTSN